MSKFNKIFEARSEEKSRTKNAEDIKKRTGKPKKEVSLSSHSVDKESSSTASQIEDQHRTASELIAAPEKKRGRPPAKRSDPQYLGFTTYIRRETHLRAKIALLQEGKRRELSELVEELLSQWLEVK